MRPISLIGFFLLVLACAAVVAVPSLPGAGFGSDIVTGDSAGSQRLADLRRGRALARQQAERARLRADGLDRAAREAQNASAIATLRAAALATRIQHQEGAIAEAEAKQAILSLRRADRIANLSRQRAPVTRLMAGLQNLVRRPPIVGLMQPLSLEDTVHLRAIVAAIGPQIRTRTAALQDEIDHLKVLEREADALTVEKRQFRAKLEANRKTLLSLSAAEQLRAQRAMGAADREAERAFAIAETSRSLVGLTQRLEAASQQPKTKAGMAPGLFQPPVIGPEEPSKRTAGKGITYLPTPSAQVVAPRDGRVAFAGPYRGYGTVVILEHADGWTSLVTGLASGQVRVGQNVVAGSPLGRAQARLPAITLEVRRGGVPMRAEDVVR